MQVSNFFCVCIALVIPLLVLSTSRHGTQEDVNNAFDRFEQSNHQNQQPSYTLTDDNNDHFVFKKAADFERILQPCNLIPASSGGGLEYANCVRSRMLLMGRRKRRQANYQ